jgi:hypothetical protein
VIIPSTWRCSSMITTACERPSVSTGSRLIAGARESAVSAGETHRFGDVPVEGSSRKPTMALRLPPLSITGSVRMLCCRRRARACSEAASTPMPTTSRDMISSQARSALNG